MIMPHAFTSGVATSASAECSYESFPRPPCLLELAPSDFCLFPLLKQHLCGTTLIFVILLLFCLPDVQSILTSDFL